MKVCRKKGKARDSISTITGLVDFGESTSPIHVLCYKAGRAETNQASDVPVGATHRWLFTFVTSRFRAGFSFDNRIGLRKTFSRQTLFGEPLLFRMECHPQ
ncbi:hypothetical protein QUF70_18405 [Desulfobacterales bacterium HSG17]|nr:hypothetical protein [Desulfobacterales bacterium HSG17]